MGNLPPSAAGGLPAGGLPAGVNLPELLALAERFEKGESLLDNSALYEKVKSGAATQEDKCRVGCDLIMQANSKELEAFLAPPFELLKGWEDPKVFTPSRRDAVASALSMAGERSVHPQTEELARRGFETVKLCLEAGLTFAPEELRAFLDVAFEETRRRGGIKGPDVVRVMKLLHDHGVNMNALPGVSKGKGIATLTHWAAEWNLKEVVEFALDELKCDVNAIWSQPHDRRKETISLTPLYVAVGAGNYDIANMLVARYGARSCIPGINTPSQPLMVAHRKGDTPEGFALLKAMLASQKDVLDTKYWPPISDGMQFSFHIMALEFDTDVYSLLFDSGQEGMDKVLTEPVVMPSLREKFTVAAFAAMMEKWTALDALVKHGASVLAPARTSAGKATTIAELVRKNKDCPRKTSALVEAAYQREMKDKQEGKSAPAGSPATTVGSNAVEDPSVKVLTEQEEKRKAKKRAAKKKAKAKKRATAAEANAGAGKAEEDESSSDSGDDTEEEGMTEEERMLSRAPTFDLEKERKRRAEAKMSTLSAATLTLALLCSTATLATAQSGAGQWQLTFFDDFTGTSLNTTTWTIKNNETHCSPCEPQLYVDSALSVSNGSLIITTERLTNGSSIIGPGGARFNFTSGWLDTGSSFAQKYGKFEARMKLPSQKSTGIWPAFWSLPTNKSQCWPMGGEIDVFEYTANPFDNQVFGSYRWGTQCGNDNQILPGAGYPPLGAPVIDWSADYHVFSVVWNETSLTFLVDGNAYETKTSSQVILPTSSQYLILDAAVAWYFMPGNDAVYPALTYVDWVKAWQWVPENAASSSSPLLQAAVGGEA
jgi:beta-glucanase (GH16 family)